VLHFAGDAMIVVFLPTEDEKKSDTMKEDVCYRSVNCIQSVIQKYGKLFMMKAMMMILLSILCSSRVRKNYPAWRC